MNNNMQHHFSDKKIAIHDLNVAYAGKQALFHVSLDIKDKQVTALIGPSGCGKTTFLRSLNRMHKFDEDCSVWGSIKLDGTDIQDIPGNELRTRVGMVFQKPNPFPQSIYDNIAYGPRIHGMCQTKQALDRLVAESLTEAGLYDEVKANLHMMATKLSGGQQQRLCIARALAVKPEVILMDEPCSSLDPVSTSRVESLIKKLATRVAVVIVTHSMEQASRIAQWTAFFSKGSLVEYSKTSKMFTTPAKAETLAYITRRFG